MIKDIDNKKKITNKITINKDIKIITNFKKIKKSMKAPNIKEMKL